MEDLKAHPNTRAMLEAWRRLSEGSAPTGPHAEDHPGLIERLFVLTHTSERDYPFSRVGMVIERLFGRQLFDHNFLTLWSETDRHIIDAVLGAALSDHGPAIIRARGETLTGVRLDLELALAPLRGHSGGYNRFLGLCQTMMPEEMLGRRPLTRLQVVAVFPPAPRLEPSVRIVRSR